MRLTAIEKNESVFMRTEDNIDMTNLGLNPDENMFDQMSNAKFDQQYAKFTSKSEEAKLSSV